MKKWLNWQAAIIGAILIVCGGLIYYVRSFDALPQSSHVLFDEIPAIKSTDKLMVISPHQDDETIGAGGLIERALSSGAQVEVVFATDGNKHGLAATRAVEAQTADKNLGLPASQLVFLNFPDGNLAAQTDFPAKLSAEITKFQPTLVATTLPEDTHPDHAACGQVVLDLWRGGVSWQPMFFLVHYHGYPRPMDVQPNSYLLPPLHLINTEYDWQILTLTENEQATKHQSIADYHSQLSLTNPVLRQLLWLFDRKNELFAVPNK
ncbi:MAG TPA: PIG-L family deacetylase [Candidatus Saccharimonadales bacterium]|nr:PIG-L family deacetylase [Candidatus Saccharimonadales bacterium]